MRRSIIILPILALGTAGVSAMAQTTGAVDAYPGAHGDNAIAGGIGNIIIGNPHRERNAAMARLDDRRLHHSDGTMDGQADGGTGMGGSAGGVGSR